MNSSLSEDFKKYKFLPEKHWFAHDYCIMIHDIFAQIVVEGEKAKIFNIIIEDEKDELLKKLENAEG